MSRTSPARPGRDGGINWVKAVVLIAALVVVGIAILHYTGTSSKGAPVAGAPRATTTTSSTTLPGPTTTTTLLPASQIKVLVLNGASASKPLAGEWTVKLQAKGYTTETPANATSTVAASAIYVVTPGYLTAAQQLAQAIGDPTITINQTIGATAPITTSEQAKANLILVIGPDLAASA